MHYIERKSDTIEQCKGFLAKIQKESNSKESVNLKARKQWWFTCCKVMSTERRSSDNPRLFSFSFLFFFDFTGVFALAS